MSTAPEVDGPLIRLGSDSTFARCLSCGGDCFRPYPTAFEWLARCRRCGCLFADPQPDEEELACLYAGQYFQFFGAETGDHSEQLPYRRMMRLRAERMLGLLESLTSPGRLLDVGCGLGDFAAVAAERGWQPEGVEPNPVAAAWLRERYSFPVHSLPMEAFAGPPESFAAITAWDVLEHLRQPRQILRDWLGLVKPGGLLLLTTPDAGCLAARLLGRRWPHFHRDHLWYFNQRGLSRLLIETGWEVLSCATPRKIFTLDYLFNILSRSEQSGPLQWLGRIGLRITPEVIKCYSFPLPEGILSVARRPER